MKEAKLTESEAFARSLAAECLADSIDKNHIFSEAHNVKILCMQHYVDMSRSDNGIESLVGKILQDHEAHFELGAEFSPDRAFVLNKAMYSHEIIREVLKTFSKGSIRYPAKSIRTYLSIYLRKKGLVQSIELSPEEDKGRFCKKTRLKWYWIKPKTKE
jgi:hypothetical protein